METIKVKSPITQTQGDDVVFFINVCKHMSMDRVRDNNHKDISKWMQWNAMEEVV